MSFMLLPVTAMCTSGEFTGCRSAALSTELRLLRCHLVHSGCQIWHNNTPSIWSWWLPVAVWSLAGWCNPVGELVQLQLWWVFIMYCVSCFCRQNGEALITETRVVTLTRVSTLLFWQIRCSVNRFSLCLIGHFSGEPGLTGVYWSEG